MGYLEEAEIRVFPEERYAPKFGPTQRPESFRSRTMSPIVRSTSRCIVEGCCGEGKSGVDVLGVALFGLVEAVNSLCDIERGGSSVGKGIPSWLVLLGSAVAWWGNGGRGTGSRSTVRLVAILRRGFASLGLVCALRLSGPLANPIAGILGRFRRGGFGASATEFSASRDRFR